MKVFIEDLVKRFIDNTKELKIIQSQENGLIRIQIKTAREDVGKVIGKQGKNINAIRTIVNAIGAKERRRYSIEIDEA